MPEKFLKYPIFNLMEDRIDDLSSEGSFFGEFPRISTKSEKNELQASKFLNFKHRNEIMNK